MRTKKMLPRKLGVVSPERGRSCSAGGLSGVLEAACRGARKESGITIEIITGISGENRYLSVIIRSGLSNEGNAVPIQSSTAVVAIEGRYGNLS